MDKEFESLLEDFYNRRIKDKSIKYPMAEEQSIGRIKRTEEDKYPLDYASLYPSKQRVYYVKGNSRRIEKNKRIKEILNDNRT